MYSLTRISSNKKHHLSNSQRYRRQLRNGDTLTTSENDKALFDKYSREDHAAQTTWTLDDE